MPRQASEKGFNTFVQGIVTESSALNFPENASIDEQNFVLNRDGSRQRRLGIDFEDSFVTSGGFPESTVQTSAVGTTAWYNAGNDGSNNFAVVQIGTELQFFDLEQASISGNKKSFTVNLLDFAKPATVEVGVVPIEGVSGRGLFFVVSSELEPFLIEYNPTLDTITTSVVPIRVRDILGVDDGLAIDNRPATLSDAHNYNLLNQGWQASSITAANSAFGGFPSNADVQSLARKDDATFDFTLNSDPTIVGTTPASKGSQVLNPFIRDRTSKVAALSVVSDNGRPETVEFFAGRVVMAGVKSDIDVDGVDEYIWNDTIFFSQTLTTNSKAGEFLQEADPASENISDLIASDGGTIAIPEIGTIIKLVTIRDILIIFADNGVWQISGDSGAIFSALVFNVSQITTSGAIGRDSIVKLEDKVIYWSEEGIFAIQGDSQTGLLAGSNIVAKTIQTLYLGIDNIGKRFAQGIYDKVARKVRFMYSSGGTNDGLNWRFRFDTELVFDLELKAWTVIKFGSLASDSPYPAGYVITPFEVISQTDVPITVGGVPVTVSGEEVVVKVNRVERREVTEVKYLTVVPSGTTADITFSIVQDRNYLDWFSADSVGVDAPAFLVTGHFHGGDLPKQKLTTFLYMFLQKTETVFELDTDGVSLVPDNPSSCLCKAQWDYNNTSTGNRHSRVFEAYRHRRDVIPTSVGDSHDTGQDVVVTRNKLRGKGRALSLRMDTAAGKDLHLLGWHLDLTVVS